ncbi:hypothetical protein [Reinekea blandensis]|uniref:Heat shock protein HtpX n=1 Tax=Reinekea blandensis MED297 TaxID=314283 RepID=A4BF73_9GAMM|nr:hypothetical protein [Reinekea blandensis]EAR09186.1 heat shock protein HtpX [Reinekea sp. MED297] [Reinekea blandensis MED297]
MRIKNLPFVIATAAIVLTGCNSESDVNDDSAPISPTGPLELTDDTWSAGQDRILGLNFSGTATTPVLSMMKGAPVSGQDGDLFTLRTVTYPDTTFSDLRVIDNANDRQDYQDFDIITANAKDYVIACQDGNNTVGYAQPVKLQIWQADAPSDIKTIKLEDANGAFTLRDCNALDAQFTQGTSEAMAAQVFVVGYSEPTGGGFGGDRLVRVDLTVDTTKTIAAGAVTASTGTDDTAANGLYFVDDNFDRLDAVAVHRTAIYLTQFDDSTGANQLYFLNPAAANPTATLVSESTTDVFANAEQAQWVEDMVVVPGISDHDKIYLVSSSSAPGVAIAGYRPYVNNVPAQPLALSTDTLAERCSDVIAAVANAGSGQLMWCYDSTDAGKIIQLQVPFE